MTEENPKETLGEKVLKTGLGALSGYLVAEAYTRWATPEQKRKWESLVKTHHGEAGAVIAIVGTATKFSELAGVGLGLMVHDFKDVKKWFSGDKRKMYTHKA